MKHTRTPKEERKKICQVVSWRVVYDALSDAFEKKQNEESIYIVHVDPRDETGNLLERDPLGIDIKS